MTHRVAVTGCGVVSALGNSFADLAKALRAGQSGVRLAAPGTRHRATAAACPSLEATDFELAATERALFDPVTRFAVLAAQQALEESGLDKDPGRCRSAAVYIGTALGGVHSLEDAYRDIWYHGAPPKPLTIVCAMANAPAAHLAMRFGIQGPNMTYSVACASSAIAIGEAFHAIRAGRLACALAGGAEACVTTGVVRSWQAMRMLATVDHNAPEESCRPFSRDRTGIVLGEGAAMLVLERLEDAVQRGAPILCELLGYAANADATHICIPALEGQASAMAGALADAQLAPESIDYLNAHGTATRAGDITETRAIREAFGKYADALPVSSTKSVHGHLLGAAGALELAVCIVALRERLLPATMHLRQRDAECDLDFVANAPRPDVEVRRVMSNSFAFGGSNAVLVAARVD
ncbi:MAG TPA: beta-ketoacyl-[acyl-carrier-protein] synthase family protein [Steroidobacteraceae bacterium]|jgi:3-oxoacyl-[acyl-carrier-protein] synthase II|nr:beta-ketoacyl-[acyl-carrier-protein] synthase family protein [Steroidobacteraceae bacterium]